MRACETSLPTSTVCTGAAPLGPDDKNNFAPRLGFAYKASDKTVIRGAYGIFYQPEPYNQFVFLSINPPFISFYNRFNNSSNYQSWDWYNPTAGLPPGGIQFTYIPQDSVTPFLQAWSLGVQREIAGNVVDITYAGNKDSHLWARTWPNQPAPGPGDIDVAASVHQRVHHRRQRADRQWQLQRLCRSARSAVTRTGWPISRRTRSGRR